MVVIAPQIRELAWTLTQLILRVHLVSSGVIQGHIHALRYNRAVEFGLPSKGPLKTGPEETDFTVLQ